MPSVARGSRGQIRPPLLMDANRSTVKHAEAREPVGSEMIPVAKIAESNISVLSSFTLAYLSVSHDVKSRDEQQR